MMQVLFKVGGQYFEVFSAYDTSGANGAEVNAKFNLAQEELLDAYVQWKKSDKEHWETFDYPKKVYGWDNFTDRRIVEVFPVSRGKLAQEHDLMMSNRPEFGIRPTRHDCVIDIEDALIRLGKSAQSATV
ncbi:MAG: hypothetical protein RLZZ490_1480 [Cyanobacteriota bacterium]|jgi:hypothetical protein